MSCAIVTGRIHSFSSYKSSIRLYHRTFTAVHLRRFPRSFSSSTTTMASEIPQKVHSDKVKIAGPYSPAAIIPATARTIYCSGQVPMDASGKLVEGSITDMTRQCITNLKNVLEDAGSSLKHVVKCVVFLTDMKNFQEVNTEYLKWFGEDKPARSCVAVHQLPLGVPVEIECVAVLPGQSAKL